MSASLCLLAAVVVGSMLTPVQERELRDRIGKERLLIFLDPRAPEPKEWQPARVQTDRTERRLVLVRAALEKDAGAMRKRWNVKPGVVAVLVGLDGQIKKEYAKTPQPEEVFALIDTMPMRRREMRD